MFKPLQIFQIVGKHHRTKLSVANYSKLVFGDQALRTSVTPVSWSTGNKTQGFASKGGAHFPGAEAILPKSRANIQVPLQHTHPHKSVTKIGDNEWQASLLINDEFYELGVFNSKMEAAQEVREWKELFKDEPATDKQNLSGILSSVGIFDPKNKTNTKSWIQPDNSTTFQNPILNVEESNLVAGSYFVIEDLIEALQFENAKEISILDITCHRGGGDYFGDYLVTVTGLSQVIL